MLMKAVSQPGPFIIPQRITRPSGVSDAPPIRRSSLSLTGETDEPNSKKPPEGGLP
jgi:hypothetical protein